MRRLVLVLTLPALLLSACAGAGPGPSSGDAPDPTTPGSGGRLAAFQASTIVLQKGDEPAQLCLGGVLESLPPQCGDVPVPNWDWDAVEGEERMSGVIWGSYHVTGFYDGETFTLSEVGPFRTPDPGPADDPIVAPCDEPAGGWTAPDPSRGGMDDVERISGSVRSEPDFAGLWVDYVNDPESELEVEDGEIILTVAFTGDLDRHRAELEQEWGGPLCVWQFEHAYSELESIQTGLFDELKDDFGLRMLSSSVAETRNVIEVTVILATEEDRAALDERYGAGVVVLDSALKPA